MLKIISRQQAIDKISKTVKHGECLMCCILRSNVKYILHKGEFTTVILSGFPRTWGQTMIILNEHKISVSTTTKEEWEELSINIKKMTKAIEDTLKPLRCYITSLGATENLLNTCPHLHFNLLPIYNASDKPENIFTWRNGVYDGTVLEWEDLYCKLMLSWHQQTSDILQKR